MKFSIQFGIVFVLIASAVTGGYLQPSATAVPSNSPPTDIVPVDTNMHDFMEAMFQTPYRRLKEAMANEPKDNNGWRAVRSDLLILAEGSNLLVLRKQEKDQSKWDEFSLASKKAGEAAFKAGKKKNFAETRKAYESMLVQCNDCHKMFADGKHQLAP